MDTLGADISSALTNTVQSLLRTSLNPHVYFVPDDTRLQIFFRKDEEFEEDYWLQKSYLKSGGVVMGIIVGLGVLAVLVATCLKAQQSRVLADGLDELDEDEQMLKPGHSLDALKRSVGSGSPA